MIILHLFYKKNGPYDYEIWTRILLHYTILKNGPCNGRKDRHYAHTKYHGMTFSYHYIWYQNFKVVV